MRILLVVHGFPPAVSGGSEIYAHDLEAALRRVSKHEVFVLTREADATRPEHAVRLDTSDGRQVYWINNTYRRCRSFEETYRHPGLRAVVAEILDRVRPDVAHVQHLTNLTTDLLPELRSRNVPTVFTLNDYWLLCHRGQLLNTRLERCEGPTRGCVSCVGNSVGVGAAGYTWKEIIGWLGSKRLARAAHRVASVVGSPSIAAQAMDTRVRHMQHLLRDVDRFIAPSRTLEERFKEFGIPAERISRLQQGIDLRAFRNLKREPRRGPLRLGFTGSLMVSKAPHLLLEAFARLRPGAATVDLYGDIAPYHGDDSYRRRLEPLLKTPGVRHYGPLPHRDMPQVLAGLDVLVVPSIWLENAPFVIREAYAAGVPVIASNLGGMAEMVRHDETGLLFRPGDATDLRRAIERLMAEPALLSRLASRAPAMMSIDHDARQLVRIYGDLARVRKRRLPTRKRQLAAVIVNYRTPMDTVLAGWSVERSQFVDHLIVVDNGSGDDSESLVHARLPRAQLIQAGGNLGFAGGCNLGIRAALKNGAERVLLLGADALITRDTVERLERGLDEHAEAGIAGPIVLARADPSHIASAGIRFSTQSGRMRHLQTNETYDRALPPPTRIVAAVDGCAMLIRAEVFERIGLLREDYFFYFEEVDFCLRAREQGFESIVVGDAVAYHEGARSIGADSPLRLYYAARNHQLAAKRFGNGGPLRGFLRVGSIAGLNVAYALTSGRVAPGSSLRAVARGTLDHFRGRYGPFMSSRR
jgi:GT2 family glycosyltransferase/glycosyltransferase involved in cell wall biosynthesis